MIVKGSIPCAGGRIEIYDSKLVCVKRRFNWHQMCFSRSTKTFEYSKIEKIDFLMPTFFHRGYLKFVMYSKTNYDDNDRDTSLADDCSNNDVITLSRCTKTMGKTVCEGYHLILELKATNDLSMKKRKKADDKMFRAIHPDRWARPISQTAAESFKLNDDRFENINQRLTPISASYTTDPTKKYLESEFFKKQKTPFSIFSTKVVGISYYQENIEKMIRALKATNLIEPNIRYYDPQVWRYYSGSKIYEFNKYQDFGNMVLEPEPANIYDGNAIKVMIYGGNDREYFIGYIPRDITYKVAPIIDDPGFFNKYYIHYYISGGDYKYLSFQRGENMVIKGHSNYFAYLQIIKY